MALQIRGTGERRRATTIGVNEILVYTVVALAFLLGGTPSGANGRILLVCVASCALLSWALFSGAWPAFRRLPFLARLALILIPCVPLAQIVPLPPAVWTSLPGRETAKAVFALVGADTHWHSLSVTPRGTLFALLMLLPPYAVFFGTLALDESARMRCIRLFVALAGLSILVGLLQVGSRGATLQFYQTAHNGHLLGFFTNRNHEGLMLALAAIFSLVAVQIGLADRRAAIFWSAILSVTFLGAAIATSSRTGMVLTVAGLLAINYHYFVGRLDKRQLLWIVVACLLVAAAAYALSFSRVVEQSVARYDSIGDDDRWTIWRDVWPLVQQYSPWGSGIGSFVPAYAAIEAINNVGPSYINRAHNEYLETLIEGGIPGLAVLALFGVALVQRALSGAFGKRRFSALGIPAGLAILLVALHSILDYPLRTQTIAVLFAMFLAFFLEEGGARPDQKRVRVRVERDQNGDPHAQGI